MHFNLNGLRNNLNGLCNINCFYQLHFLLHCTNSIYSLLTKQIYVCETLFSSSTTAIVLSLLSRVGLFSLCTSR
jgi:hypothetical protein